MLNFKKYVASMATISSFLFISSSAWAMEVAFASSQTTLYWDSFSGLNDFTWYGKSTNAASRVASAWEMDANILAEAPASAVPGWVDLNRTSFYSSNPDISASGVIANNILTASAVTEVIYPGDIYTSDANSRYNGVFSVSATSTYTISIDYSISQSLAISGSPGSSADALSYIYFTLQEWNESSSSFVLVRDPIINDYRNSLVGGMEGPTSFVYDTDTLTFSFDQKLEAGKYYNFTGGAYTYSGAEAPVPIPGAVWLLGSGLLGMIAIRRKSAQQSN